MHLNLPDISIAAGSGLFCNTEQYNNSSIAFNVSIDDSITDLIVYNYIQAEMNKLEISDSIKDMLRSSDEEVKALGLTLLEEIDRPLYDVVHQWINGVSSTSIVLYHVNVRGKI